MKNIVAICFDQGRGAGAGGRLPEEGVALQAGGGPAGGVRRERGEREGTSWRGGRGKGGGAKCLNWWHTACLHTSASFSLGSFRDDSEKHPSRLETY